MDWNCQSRRGEHLPSEPFYPRAYRTGLRTVPWRSCGTCPRIPRIPPSPGTGVAQSLSACPGPRFCRSSRQPDGQPASAQVCGPPQGVRVKHYVCSARAACRKQPCGRLGLASIAYGACPPSDPSQPASPGRTRPVRPVPERPSPSVQGPRRSPLEQPGKTMQGRIMSHPHGFFLK